MVRDTQNMAISYSRLVSTEGEFLSDHVFAILEHFSQTKEYYEVGWLLLSEL